jgi:hypothetical protein
LHKTGSSQLASEVKDFLKRHLAMTKRVDKPKKGRKRKWKELDSTALFIFRVLINFNVNSEYNKKTLLLQVVGIVIINFYNYNVGFRCEIQTRTRHLCCICCDPRSLPNTSGSRLALQNYDGVSYSHSYAHTPHTIHSNTQRYATRQSLRGEEGSRSLRPADSRVDSETY